MAVSTRDRSDQAREEARLFRNRILDALEIPGDRNEAMGLAQHGGTINHSGGTLRIGTQGQVAALQIKN